MQTQVGQPNLTWDQIMRLVTPPPLPPSSDKSAALARATDVEDSAPADEPDPTDTRPSNPVDILGPSPITREQQQQLISDELGGRADVSKFLDQYQQDRAASRAQQDQIFQSEMATVNAQPPAQPQPTANPLQRMAPLLLISAFGGKLSKLDAGAMLAATTGTVKGYLAGDQQKFEAAQKQYEDAYKTFKDRQDQQLKIFEEMRKAYGDQPDADLKALDTALKMTGDNRAVDQGLLEMQAHWQQAVGQLAERDKALADQNYLKRAMIQIAQQNADTNAKKADQAAGGANAPTDDELRTLAQTAIKTGHDPSFGMGANAIRDRYNSIKAQEIQKVGGASGAVGQQMNTRVQQAEATAVGRREGQIAPAMNALNRPGGLYDQLESSAQKLDFTSDEVKNNIRLGIANHVYANPQIQDYVTSLMETRADLANVLSRGGQVTDQSRTQANDAIPAIADYPTLHAAISRSRSVANAINAGNQTVIDAITKGQSVADASQYSVPSKGDVSADTLKAYAKKHGIPLDQAKSYLIQQGYTVQ
jgi:hypothetical protein